MTTNPASRDLSDHPKTQGTDSAQVRYSVLSPVSIWIAAVVIVLVGVGAAVWLLLAYGHGDDQDRNQLEAIKTAGTIVVGTGGAAALLLAARRQRTAEIALKQKDRDQAHQERAHALQERVAAETMAHQQRVAADAQADSIERRITELYAKAADQLGSDKAPVRLAGLYALERLAQDNETQRQTIVNLLCAYLRMPYEPPAALADDGDAQTVFAHQESKQELEVRVAAQRVLAGHLRPGKNFWKGIGLDLTGAVLIDLDLSECSIGTATFTTTHFTGIAQFSEAQFTEAARFDRSQFDQVAGFEQTRFGRLVRFDGARFDAAAWFDEAEFCVHGILGDDAQFHGARFNAIARFGLAKFNGLARFDHAQFMGAARFEGALFDATARFNGAHFNGAAWFDDAQFNGTAAFSLTQFKGPVGFDETQFEMDVPKELTKFYVQPQDNDMQDDLSLSGSDSE